MATQQLYSPADVAARLGVSRRTVYKWMAERKLPYVKLGAAVRIDEAAVERIVRRGVPA